MIFICPILFIGWKVIKKTKFYRPDEVDLAKDLAEIEEYQSAYDRDLAMSKASLGNAGNGKSLASFPPGWISRHRST